MKGNLSRLSKLNQIIVTGLLVIMVPALMPQTTFAQTDTKTLVLEIKNVPKIPDVATIQNLSNPDPQPEQAAQVDPITINTPILQQYLAQKGSPLAPYASDILQYDNWKLVLAISNGESTMCKHQMYNNCWGVGGAWNLRRYESFSKGFADVDKLLANKYIPTGADTPKEIVRKYVGHANANWVLAVNQILNQLDQLPLQN